jgi:ABC-type polysaccharide/polyol phosphate export permease
MLLLFNTCAAWTQHRPWKTVFRELLIPGTVSVLVFCVFLAYQFVTTGTLQGFFYQAVLYPLSESYQNGSEQAPTLAQLQFALSAMLLVPAGLAAVPYAKRTGKSTLWSRLCAATILLAGSLILAYPRFAPFHLQPALPLVAVLSAVGIAAAFKIITAGRSFLAGVILALVAWWLLVAGAGYTPAFKDGSRRKIAEYSPLISLAEEVRAYTGSEPPSIFLFLEDESSSNLYYLLGSTPDGFWVFHYPWYMVEQDIKSQLYTGLVEAQPEWVLEFPDIWNVKPMAHEIALYIETYYDEAAILQGGQVLYHRK